MIRLNDINKTVIDESKVVAYYVYEEGKTYCISIVLNIKFFVDYNSQEARDKDIELLDKIFDVKSIEEKANAYPDEIDALKFAMSGIKKECELVKEDDEDYVYWGDVCQLGSLTVELPNGGIVKCTYNPQADNISFSSPTGDKKADGYIYNEDLFNALMLKKVE